MLSKLRAIPAVSQASLTPQAVTDLKWGFVEPTLAALARASGSTAIDDLVESRRKERAFERASPLGPNKAREAAYQVRVLPCILIRFALLLHLHSNTRLRLRSLDLICRCDACRLYFALA